MAARQAYTRRYGTQAGRKADRQSGSGQMYVYGNTVTKPAYEPERREKSPEKTRKRLSRETRRNRNAELHMNPGYVIFLTVAAIMALIICVNYVSLQSKLTEHSKEITSMQEELADLKEENTTRENAILDSVNMDEIAEKAQNELGMQFADEDHIVEYDNPVSDYVKQYDSIPEDGVLAKSE